LDQQDICLRTSMRIKENSFNSKKLIITCYLAADIEKKTVFSDRSTKPKIGIL
jgi:hypothetical protein